MFQSQAIFKITYFKPGLLFNFCNLDKLKQELSDEALLALDEDNERLRGETEASLCRGDLAPAIELTR